MMRVSKQVRYQRKMLKAGRCIICGEKRNLYAFRCDDCQRDFRIYFRQWRHKNPITKKSL